MLTITEAAFAVARHPDLVRRWIKSGRIAGAVQARSGEWLLPLSALDILRAQPRVHRRRPAIS